MRRLKTKKSNSHKNFVPVRVCRIFMPDGFPRYFCFVVLTVLGNRFVDYFFFPPSMRSLVAVHPSSATPTHPCPQRKASFTIHARQAGSLEKGLLVSQSFPPPRNLVTRSSLIDSICISPEAGRVLMLNSGSTLPDNCGVRWIVRMLEVGRPAELIQHLFKQCSPRNKQLEHDAVESSRVWD